MIFPRSMIAVLLAAAACAPAAAPDAQAPEVASDTASPAAWPTILTAPPIVDDDRLPGPVVDSGRSAIGGSVAHAQRVARLQNELAGEIGRLDRRLSREQAGNFADLWIEHEPDWHVVVAFKRDAESTLRRYTRHPLFAARQVRFSLAELVPAMDRAIEQLRATGIPFGGGLDVKENLVIFDLGAPQPEVDALVASGRVTASPMLRLRGIPAVEGPAIAPAAARFVRILPHQDYANIAETEELNVGRIILRDGCLRVAGADEPFAYFALETGVTISDSGRLAFVDRRTGRAVAHVGERMVLGGGAGREITDPAITAPIHAACGAGRVVYVGNPRSYTVFRRQNVAWQVDDRARREGISREEAWRRIRACWARQDEGAAGPPCELPPPPPPPAPGVPTVEPLRPPPPPPPMETPRPPPRG